MKKRGWMLWMAAFAVSLVVVDREPARAQDFSIEIDPTELATCGDEAVFEVTVQPLGGFAGAVTLSVTGIPPGAVANFSTNPVNPPETTTLTISNLGAVTPGSFPLTVDGVSDALTRSAMAQLDVFDPADCDFTIAVSPSRFSLCGSIEPTFTVEVASINGFVDLVSLNVLGLPPGTSALFSENPVMPPGTSTLALSGFASLPPGVYALTVDGTSTDRSRSAEATVAVEVDCRQVPAFSVGGIVLVVGALAGVGLLALLHTRPSGA